MTNKTIVFSDVDGTLLNSNHKVSKGTREAILKLQEQGIPFVIVTGRGPTGVYPILEDNDFNCAMITYSGALILDENRNILYEKRIPIRKVEEIVGFVEEEKMPLAWCIYPDEVWSVKDKTDPRIVNEARVLQLEPQEIELSKMSDEQTSSKILCICDPGTINDIEAKLKEKFTDYTIIKSSDVLLEIMSKGIDKAAAIDRLCEMWKIPIEDTIAFGDNYNDFSMLREVGHGYIMENAPEDMKAEIKNVTKDNDHDGIPFVLKELKLI
ncbi:MAG: Cof-type HAD-IIB family hydrolase [Anaerostipes sp.]|nr:Cof-type HAD-IIB family hydrolase [Anaerostipes sp.]